MGSRIQEVMRILIVEPDSAARHALIDFVHTTGVRASFETAETPGEATERALSGEFTVSLLGSTLGPGQQQRLLLSLRDRAERARCVVGCFLRAEDAKSAQSLSASGADYVLTDPYEPAKMRELFTRAASLTAESVPESQEQITSLPWILHSLATRLRALADRLEAEKPGGAPLDASPKLVKEALLGAIGTHDSEELAQEILKSARSESPK